MMVPLDNAAQAGDHKQFVKIGSWLNINIILVTILVCLIVIMNF